MPVKFKQKFEIYKVYQQSSPINNGYNFFLSLILYSRAKVLSFC